ncbi:hypothetical protein Poli38472_012240 [Pythium oligandrum]|uniref:Uncharacterized protein n=1 Tax=Pythium oligandrum TaxID=41045 RepID=A0A8K1FNA8_PYTOL|nr:hypothetical protein Poli38472_012240 [Pythium oligandrum]|eukprot:TMW67124.1 hypothetical protein Poli38472_012240 [Pythium oligandrum]
MIEEEEWSKEQEANRKPGQKHPTPSPGHADRVFYESLLQQRPQSRMAKKWCLEYGVLKWAEAEALCKELGIAINVTRPAKASSGIKKEKASRGRSTNYEKQEAMAAEAMGITGGGFEGVGIGTL